MTRDDILRFIREHPFSSGADILVHMRREAPKPAWVLRWFGEDSLVAALFEPTSASLYPMLADLEQEFLVAGVWLPGPYPRRRVYFPMPERKLTS